MSQNDVTAVSRCDRPRKLPKTQDPEALLRLVVRTVALGHLVPAGPQDLGSLAGHSQEQGALFCPFKESGRSRARLPQATEGRPEGEAEKVGGAQERGKRRRRTAVSRRPRRAHERVPSGQDARLRPGIEKETEGVTLVSRRHRPRQFPLRPYTPTGESPPGTLDQQLHAGSCE